MMRDIKNLGSSFKSSDLRITKRKSLGLNHKLFNREKTLITKWIIYSKRDKYLPLAVYKTKTLFKFQERKAVMVLKKATSELMKFSNMRGSRSRST